MEHGAYGDRLGSRFGVNNPPVLRVRALRKSGLAVTDILNDNPDLGRSLPIPPEDAFLVHLHMRTCLGHDLLSTTSRSRLNRFPLAAQRFTT